MSLYYFTLYDYNTGLIEQVGTAAIWTDAIAMAYYRGLGIIEGQYNGSTHYIDPITLKPQSRPSMIVNEQYTVKVGVAWSVPAPVGTKLTINNSAPIVADDRGFTVVFNYPGTYNAQFDMTPPGIDNFCRVIVTL